MRVVVERDEPRRRVKVYVLHDGVDRGGWNAVLVGEVLRWVAVADGEIPVPLLVLPEDVFAAVVGEGLSIVPESAVMERAWVDAIGVRDRLLAIVERIEL